MLTVFSTIKNAHIFSKTPICFTLLSVSLHSVADRFRYRYRPLCQQKPNQQQQQQQKQQKRLLMADSQSSPASRFPSRLTSPVVQRAAQLARSAIANRRSSSRIDTDQSIATDMASFSFDSSNTNIAGDAGRGAGTGGASVVSNNGAGVIGSGYNNKGH